MFGLYNKPYRYKRYDDTSILDDQINLQSLYFKIAIFYHYQLHKKIGEVLEIVFGDYPVGEYFFMPPNNYLISLYEQLVRKYLEIDRRPDFCELPLIEVRAFLHLRDDFHFDIASWSESRKDFFNDDVFLAKRVPQQYHIAPDLELAFQRIDEELKYHKQKKAKLLNKLGDTILTWNRLILNKSKATLTYMNNPSVTISFNNPIKLLEILLKNNTDLVEYLAIAESLELNAFRQDLKNKDVARNVQFIKKELNKILEKTGMSKEEINNMILTLRNTGFKLR